MLVQLLARFSFLHLTQELNIIKMLFDLFLDDPFEMHTLVLHDFNVSGTCQLPGA